MQPPPKLEHVTVCYLEAGAVRPQISRILSLLVLLLLAIAPFASPGRAQDDASKEKAKRDIITTAGIENRLPAFTDRLKARTTHSLSWTSGRFTDFEDWKRQARATVREGFQEAPSEAPWGARTLAEEVRENYRARKVEFNVTGDSRVTALITLPLGEGPFPAVVLFHDHGARFDIGKEKVIRPFDDDPNMASAREWTHRYYGGRFLGDELAKRGYVCIAIDALNWSERGGGGSDAQASIASNLMHLGMSFAGLVAWEDLRTVEFLATLPEVDAARIGALGFSYGGFRTWQVGAMSDRVRAGASICWMTEVKALISAGNNHATSTSAFTMLHPGLFNQLDYPDIASLACPKPMLFIGGELDALFPPASVKAAFAKMQRVWETQGAGNRLDTRLLPVAHIFDVEMQEAAFNWLDRTLKGE